MVPDVFLSMLFMVLGSLFYRVVIVPLVFYGLVIVRDIFFLRASYHACVCSLRSTYRARGYLYRVFIVTEVFTD